MSTLSEETHLPGLHPAPKVPANSLVSDVLVLVKARLTSMVLVTALIGFLFGWRGPLDWLLLFHTLFGTLLAAAGAAALNQVFESDYDALIRQTKDRPIPAHRISRDTVLFIGVVTSAVGILYLSVTTNFLPPLLPACTLATYL